MTDFETKDSGERVQFSSGMHRDVDTGKPRFDLMLPKGVSYEEQMLTRFAKLLARGAEKYDPRNWERADSEEELERFKASAFRHFMQWFSGETDEDHGAATFFNILAAETLELKLETRETVVIPAPTRFCVARNRLNGAVFSRQDHAHTVEDGLGEVCARNRYGRPEECAAFGEVCTEGVCCTYPRDLGPYYP